MVKYQNSRPTKKGNIRDHIDLLHLTILNNLENENTEFTKLGMPQSETLGNCLYAIFESTSFEDAIRKVLLMGGDTDTNCCIVGSVAEALYGMSYLQKKDTLNNLPSKCVKILEKVYN